MGRIAAISGGSLESTEALNKYALAMTEKDKPNVLFVPTASRDDQKYIANFKEAFSALGAEVQVLELIRGNYSEWNFQTISLRLQGFVSC